MGRARRLAGQMRRRLEPVERALPVKLPGYEAGAAGSASGEDAQAPQADPATPAAEDAAARIDAARTRLRARIDPPADPDA